MVEEISSANHLKFQLISLPHPVKMSLRKIHQLSLTWETSRQHPFWKTEKGRLLRYTFIHMYVQGLISVYSTTTCTYASMEVPDCSENEIKRKVRESKRGVQHLKIKKEVIVVGTVLGKRHGKICLHC